ncbi:type VI secretion system Vgr family protein [Sphingomonas morindae]|uniref:Type VI secretion system tip protein VgrG n=1 Tax=Sphingomonas morindae TaxID=1541170 RepID=A0ABY4XDB8_9SPHN|nr:type VI secretion system tip protein TssI/VgrG [Sphingomonas morindae]USI74917.1 type VI secretion system tip protein VgrG [Sphingomonas morindae]
MKRQAEITLDAGAPIRLIHFEATERLSGLFTIEAEVVLEDRVDFLPHLGKPASIEVFELERSVRFFHALLIEALYLRQEDQGFHYRLILRPWLHLLEHNRAYRIFEQKTVVEIARVVLEGQSRRVDYGKLQNSYQPWPYCTQYRESDFAFLSRLMEREGIYYYFRHERDEHVLVLADGPGAHQPAPGYETIKLRPDWSGRSGGLAESLWTWQEAVTSGGETRVLLQSFDYQTSETRHGTAESAARNAADGQDDHEYSGDFVDEALAAHWARVRLEAARAEQRRYSGAGDAIGLHCGGRFRLDSDAAFGRGETFLITSLRYSLDAEPYRSGNPAEARRVAIEAVPAETKWRAPHRTPRPSAGPETAIIMAGGADDGAADPLGRVRVRFLWGRPDEAPLAARSCWLRVAQGSAGSGFGHVALPRTGQEVIVSFLDGNPDRPIVTGRVYNSEHLHPYDLPAHRTRALFRSRSIGASGSYAGAAATPAGPGYNELMFEDRGGAEQVYLRAQRDRLVEVLLDDAARIGRDRTATVHRDDETRVTTGDHRLTVAQGAATIEAAKSISLRVGPNSLTITPLGITLTVGPSVISLTEMGLAMNGLTITAEAETVMTLNGSVATLAGEAMLNLLGGALTIL